MNKRFTTAVVAGSILAGAVGDAGLALAYSGETDFPANQAGGLIATVIDVRQNKITATLRDGDNTAAILKGMMFFEGDVEDSELLMAYPGDDYDLTQYYRFDFESEDWEDKAYGEEITVELSESLEDNTSRILGTTVYFWRNTILAAMNIRWGRIDYGRCANSEAYLTHEEAICRAEVWDDGEIHYQPYVGWERLSLRDASEDEAGTVKVYKGTEWVAEGASDGEGDDGEGGDGAGEDGDEETPGDESGEGEIRYIDREIIREVPVEIIKTVEVEKPVEKVKTVEVEVPVEKIKTVEVQVPVETAKTVEVQVPIEKTVVETKEVVREVPVATTVLAQATDLEGVALGEVPSEEVTEPSDETAEELDEADLEEPEAEPREVVPAETVELPELGKEMPADVNLAGRIATFIAGLVSAVALLLLGIAFRKKKANN